MNMMLKALGRHTSKVEATVDDIRTGFRICCLRKTKRQVPTRIKVFIAEISNTLVGLQGVTTHAKWMICMSARGYNNVVAMKRFTTQWAIFYVNKIIFLKLFWSLNWCGAEGIYKTGLQSCQVLSDKNQE